MNTPTSSTLGPLLVELGSVLQRLGQHLTEPQQTPAVLIPTTSTLPFTSNAHIAHCVVIDGEDWAGLWVDDRLAYQGERVYYKHIVAAVGTLSLYTLKVIKADDALNRWLLEHGEFNPTDSVTDALDRGDRL